MKDFAQSFGNMKYFGYLCTLKSENIKYGNTYI